MNYSEKDSSIIAEGLVQSIQSTTILIQGLLSELRDNASSLATLEAKLQALHENVQGIIKVVRDDESGKSMITRMVLIEKDLIDIQDNFTNLKVDVSDKFADIRAVMEKLNNEHIEGKLNQVNKEEFGRNKLLYVLALLSGVVSLVISIINVIYK